MPKMRNTRNDAEVDVRDRQVAWMQRCGWELVEDPTQTPLPDPAALAEAARQLAELAEQQKPTDAGTDSAPSKEN
jgi:hypothetical protein